MKYQVFGILWTVFNLALMLVMGIVGIYLLWLVIKALRVYINSHEVREEKKATRKSLAEALRENRVRCKMTQEFVSETIGVSRQAAGSDAPGGIQVGKRHLGPQHLQPDRAGQAVWYFGGRAAEKRGTLCRNRQTERKQRENRVKEKQGMHPFFAAFCCPGNIQNAGNWLY